jgi:hypothetical protein
MFNWYASFGIDSSHVPLLADFHETTFRTTNTRRPERNSSVKGKFTVIDVEHFDPNNIDPALVVPIDLENLPQYSALLIDKRAPTSSLDAFEGYFQQEIGMSESGDPSAVLTAGSVRLRNALRTGKCSSRPSRLV